MKKIVQKLFDSKFVIGTFLLIFLLFLINTFHTQFPDEFDNIYGGFLINHGKLPYTGFFTHHNPGAYFFASMITLISGRSFVLFRVILSFILFAMYLTGYIFLKRQLKKTSLDFYLFFGIILGIGATFWWGQMLLSETIVGYLLVPALLLVVLKKLTNTNFDEKDLWMLSILTSLSLFTSLTYIYFIPIFIAVVLYFYFIENRPIQLNTLKRTCLIFALPYLVFFLYLLITGSLSEFYFASIKYNVSYYIYNFPLVSGTYSHHPIRYAISIAQHTIDNYSALLTQVSSFNLSYPQNISLAIADISFIIYLLMRRQFGLVVLIVSMIFYTNARSEPLNIKETDFHATVFIMLTLSLVTLLFYKLKEELNKNLPYFEKLIFSSIFLLTSFYWFFNILYLGNKFIDKAYGKFMGRDPLIYDRPQVAPTLNRIVSSSDYFWIGPFELQELLFIKGKIASKYFWFLPANARDEKIKNELISDLSRNKPKVIVFKKWWTTFGVNSEDFNTVIIHYLDNNYFTINDLRRDGMKFKVNVGKERNFDFEAEYFFDNNRKAEIVKQLIDQKLIEII